MTDGTKNPYWRDLAERDLTHMFAQLGSPLFFFDEHIVKTRYGNMISALQKNYPRYAVAYALKANYLPRIARILEREGALIEVASGAEYTRAKRYGYPGPRIIFNGPLKRTDELLRALEEECILHADNHEELSRITTLSLRVPRKIKIGIRLNSNTLPHKRHGGNRFGFNIESGEAARIATALRAQKNITLSGLHMHIGTNIATLDSYQKAADTLTAFAIWLQDNLGTAAEHIDIGGGFATPTPRPKTDQAWSVPAIDDFIKAIAPAFRKLISMPTLIVEPGRFLTAECMAFATQVVATRYHPPYEPHVVVDGSVSMLPTALFNDHPIYIKKKPSKEKIPTTIFGSSCTEYDILGKALLPRLKEGDVIFFESCGAYVLPRSSSFIFPIPAVAGRDHRGNVSLLSEEHSCKEDLNNSPQNR